MTQASRQPTIWNIHLLHPTQEQDLMFADTNSGTRSGVRIVCRMQWTGCSHLRTSVEQMAVVSLETTLRFVSVAGWLVSPPPPPPHTHTQTAQQQLNKEAVPSASALTTAKLHASHVFSLARSGQLHCETI